MEDEVCALAEDVVGLAAVLLEALVVHARRAAHALHHFLAQLHGRREGLGVVAENESEVDVEEVALGRDEEVVQVAVADTQDVGDHAVASAALDESVEDLGVDVVVAVPGRVVAEVLLDVAVVLLQHRRDGGGGRDALHHAVLEAGRQHAVGRQLEVEVLALQQLVHQRDQLHHQLVLPHVVSTLEQYHVLLGLLLLVDAEAEAKGRQCALEHRRLLGNDTSDHHRGGDGQRQGLEVGQPLVLAARGEPVAHGVNLARPAVRQLLQLLLQLRQLLHQLLPTLDLLQQLLALLFDGDGEHELAEALGVCLAPAAGLVELDLDVPVEELGQLDVFAAAADEEVRERRLRCVVVVQSLHELEEVRKDLFVVSLRQPLHCILPHLQVGESLRQQLQSLRGIDGLPQQHQLHPVGDVAGVAPVYAAEELDERLLVLGDEVAELPQQLLLRRCQALHRRIAQDLVDALSFDAVGLEVHVGEAAVAPGELEVLGLDGVLLLDVVEDDDELVGCPRALEGNWQVQQHVAVHHRQLEGRELHEHEHLLLPSVLQMPLLNLLQLVEGDAIEPVHMGDLV
mmetsp:Transcript_19367/g.74374  ORF Transcript_19367/g.74374 Transcript_19367/m.74374 type:complete len:569 (+) Transcript_19367:268-1974(+)